MNEERRKQQILHILAAGIRKVMEEAHLDYGKLQEIRLRTDQPLLILYQGEELFLPAGRAKKHMVTKEEIKETLDRRYRNFCHKAVIPEKSHRFYSE